MVQYELTHIVECKKCYKYRQKCAKGSKSLAKGATVFSKGGSKRCGGEPIGFVRVAEPWARGGGMSFECVCGVSTNPNGSPGCACRHNHAHTRTRHGINLGAHVTCIQSPDAHLAVLNESGNTHHFPKNHIARVLSIIITKPTIRYD